MIIQSVRKLYERRPYPHYPIWSYPPLSSGYLAGPIFANQWLDRRASGVSDDQRILCVGPGEMFPYILSRWVTEPRDIDCVDLSSRSLRRAKVRCMGQNGMSFIQQDINDFLLASTTPYDHVEAYGVLHHVPRFATTLKLISQRLRDRGTMRLMVYNQPARKWIRHLRSAFLLAGFSFESNQDLRRIRKIILELRLTSKLLAKRMQGISPQAIESDTWLADTFLHPWESQASPSQWLAYLQNHDLYPYALFDRYGELDDLPNPLKTFPTATQLTERCEDYRFENNLEIWCTKSPVLGHAETASAATSVCFSQPVRGLESLKVSYPKLWFSFPETKQVIERDRHLIGNMWRASVVGRDIEQKEVQPLIQRLGPLSLKRLARIGAITPQWPLSLEDRVEINQPLYEKLSPPYEGEVNDIFPLDRITKIVAKHFGKDLSPKLQNLIEQRLTRSLTL